MGGRVVLDPSCVWQPDPDVAALTGLLRAPTGKTEHAGAIFKDANGNYCYSTTVPGDGDSFEMRVGIPDGSALAGTFHTHPAGKASDGDSRLFSSNDISVAKQLKVPSYVRAEKDGNVRKFTPGVTAVDNIRRGGKMTESSKGDLVTAALVAALREGT